MTQANSIEPDYSTLSDQALRTIYLFVRSDIPKALQNEQWLEPVKDWLLQHRNHHLQIILQDERSAYEQLRGLNRLCQRVTSKTSVNVITNLPPSYDLPTSFLANDQGTAVLYPWQKDDQVRIINNQPGEHRSLIDDFESISRYSQRSKYFLPLTI
ncbi:DUF7931 domain-containing protein [Salinibius halmophilus]|uniref:DUF7931 domain-containing protein n=1 Tax=Salinibius halmophilus TaxID=1853216 RepID=UPI000E673D31|nr:hypothetical protein [Salinibius halmophilus]